MSTFWTELEQELEAVPAELELTRNASRSTDKYDYYNVTFSSIGHRGSGHYRLGGFLSIPTSEGQHPALLEYPRHGSVNHTPHSNERERYVVFTPMHRGQRLSDQPYRAEYPGIIRDGITDPKEYVYRGVMADYLRAADLISSFPQVDKTRIVAVGDDLAVIAAAQRPIFRAVRVDYMLFADAWEQSASTRSYPLEEFNDMRRTLPAAELAAAQQNWRQYDPVLYAPAVQCETMVSVDGSGQSEKLLQALGANGVAYTLTGQDQLDMDARDAWLSTKSGVPARARFSKAALPLPGDKQ